MLESSGGVDVVVDTSSDVVITSTMTQKSVEVDLPPPLPEVQHSTTTHAAADDDHEIIALAHERYSNSKILEAYRLLQSVKDSNLLNGKKEQEICRVAIECQNAISDLLEEPDHNAPGSKWKKQGESHGEYDTTVSYKVEDKKVTCRLVTPIHSTLLVPLLSVLNESSLFCDWIPSWTIPLKMGIRKSHQYAKIGTLDQIIHLIADIPWPFLSREVYIRSMVIGEIDEHNYFAVRLYTVHESKNDTTDDDIVDKNGSEVTIPAPPRNLQRFDFHGVLLFRPVVDASASDSQMIEVSFKMCVDPKLSVIPVSLTNFLTRTVIGTIWGKFLHVAKQVQNKERIHHMTAIKSQPELYQFIEQRVQVLLSKSANKP